MITGIVSMRCAAVELWVYGPQGHGKVKFVLDAGFTAVTTLPPAVCIVLGLPNDRIQPSELADGTTIMLEVYIATLLWDGEERKVEVLAIRPLS